jgi:hypothetical protein
VSFCAGGCGADLSGLRADAMYASDSCRKRARRGGYKARTCGGCGETFSGRVDARWCSERCRKRASRLNRDETSIAYANVLLRDVCSYCGVRSEAVDHIEPIASLGSNSWWNLTGACGSCNSSKGATPLLAFLLRGAHA